ncbi:MAG: DUF1275 domain-containing protein [Candidatus Nanopelagicales bacterium]|nr:DUF1275 domain-containing protein [Candidatus Nanopelagicales bacterium]
MADTAVDSTDRYRFFARPWLAALALAWTVGVIDAYSFEAYGVFTSNQAGNLVVLGTQLPQDPARAGLAALSLLGAVVGVAVASLIQRALQRHAWLQIAVPMLLMIALILLTSFMRQVLNSPATMLVPITSMALAGLATSVLRVPAVRGWITANTGAVLTTVHTVFEGPKARTSGGQPVQSAVMITLGFLCGALAWGSGILGSNEPTLPALLPTAVAVGLAVANDIKSRPKRV